MMRWVVGSILHGGPIELFLVPTSAPRLVYKGRGMCYPICGMMHIKETLLFIGKSSLYGGSGFPFSHSEWSLRFHYTKSNPIDDHSNISSKFLQKQNFKPLGHYTCMQCGTSHLQTVQENILSRIILATYRKFTVTTVRFTQNVS